MIMTNLQRLKQHHIKSITQSQKAIDEIDNILSMECTILMETVFNYTECLSYDDILLHKCFSWCFDNDILFKVENMKLQITSFDGNTKNQHEFMVIRFKNEEDTVAFKLKWCSNE